MDIYIQCPAFGGHWQIEFPMDLDRHSFQAGLAEADEHLANCKEYQQVWRGEEFRPKR